MKLAPECSTLQAGMLVRFANLFLSAAGLVAVWALNMGSPGGAWLHSPGAVAGPVRILQFQASVGVLTRGDKALLCYGVENAKSVRIAPMAGRVDPARNRCLEIVPDHTTRYTILAVGWDGTVATKSFTLSVESAPPAPRRKVQLACFPAPTAAPPA